MKKWLSLAVVVCSFGRILLADTVVVGGYVWMYDSYSKRCEILGCSPKPTGTLTIPSQLDGCKVTAIGEEAFKGCIGLVNVVIPDGVKEIGAGAFSGCTNLTSVAIPASVTSILCHKNDGMDLNTFDGCGGLTNIMVDAANEHYFSQNGLLLTKDGTVLVRGINGDVVIPSTVTRIYCRAFSGCAGLTSVTIPSGVSNIAYSGYDDQWYWWRDGSPFDGCGGLTNIMVDAANEHYSSQDGLLLTKDGTVLVRGINGDVVIPSAVTRIFRGAFSDCIGLTSVTIPLSVEWIGDGAFQGCTSLTSVTIPDGVEWIGDGAFQGCSSLTSVTIPDGVEDIGSEAFSGCASLTSVTIPDSVEWIGFGAFQGCSSLTSVTIPSSVEWIGTGAFSDCPNLTEGLVVDPENVFYISWNGLLIEEYDYYDESEESDPGLGNFYTTLVRGVNGVVEIPFGVTKIGVGAFSGCSGLTDVTIPSSVELIDERAFEGCIGLTGVTVPSSVEYVGERAFEGCANLTSVAVPASVVSYDDDRDGGGLERVFDTSCITNVVILDGVREIGRGMFSKCFCLTDVSIPLSVGRIGEGAFSGCVGLTDVTIPPGVRLIQEDTFLNCRGLTNVVIPSSVVCIDEGAFSGCSSLTRVTIPANLRYIGTDSDYDRDGYFDGGAFEGCSSLMYIAVDPANKFYSSRNGLLLTKDGTTLVQGVNGDVVIPSGVTRIADYSAFWGFSGLTHVSIPSSVEEIGDEAFRGCTGLTSVTIPANVTEIDYRAFLGCNGLTNFTVDAANESYVSENGLLLTKDGSVLIRGVNGDVVIPDGVTRIGDGAFSGCSGLVKVDIPGSVTEIGSEAFSGCAGLTGVTIPDGVTRIGDEAFSGCSGLVNVEIPGSVTEIGEGAFWGCSGLEGIVVDPANASYAVQDGMLVTKDGRRLVYGFRVCGDVVIPVDVTGVDFRDLAGCDGLTGVTISTNVWGIMNYGSRERRWWTDWSSRRDRCYGYKGLTNITVNAENERYFSRNGLLLTSKENWRWGKYENTDVVLVQGVNGDVVIPEGVTWITGGSFSGCMGLTSVVIPSSVRRIDSDSKYDNYSGYYSGYFGAFYGCGGLTNITVDAANTSYSSRNGLLLTGDGVTLVRGVNGNVVVPSCVRRIGEGAFSGCAGLTGVVIPSGVMGIGERAFENCGGLKSVTLPPGVVAIGESAFEGCTSLARVRLPRRFEGRLGPNVFAGCGDGLVLDYYDEARLPDSEVAASIDGDAAGGTVTGGGTYAAGKKIVLKATANKGYVFAGWELEGAALPEGADLQDPSLTLVAESVDVTARARFIPIEEDWAEVGVADGSATFAEEYATGGAFAPVTLAFAGGSRATLKVSGLPAGLKFTAKALNVRDPKTKKTTTYPANTVYGTPTKSGIYTVAATATTAGGKTATARWTFAVRKPGERIARTACDAARGTVSGRGVYAKGKKVTLKATARKGYVFAGWELEGASLPKGADPLNPALTITVGAADITATARFIPVSEDWAEVGVAEGSATFLEEYATGGAFAPVTLAFAGGSRATLKVTGLPAGLKFTAKALAVRDPKTKKTTAYPANTVYGKPTRSGIYTVAAKVATAGGKTATARWTFTVRKPGERAVWTACDAARGAVSGRGVYAKGKKVTLKATARKGYVFAGWELEGASLPEGFDARNPVLAFTPGAADVTATARFAPASEDRTLTLLVDGAAVAADGSTRLVSGGAGFTLSVASASLPKLALSGLPAGLRFDAKTGRLTGRGTKPGLYTVTAKLSNATVKKAVARRFRIEVPNFTAANALLRDGLANAPGEAYSAYIGVRDFGAPSLVPAAAARAKSMKVTGLPTGLKFDAKRAARGLDALSGVPAKAGTYVVKVAVGGKSSTFTLKVRALPSWAVGTFTGAFEGYGTDAYYYGTTTFTVSSSGKVSAKTIRQDGKSVNWTHACLDRVETDAEGGTVFRVDAVAGGFRCDVSIRSGIGRGGVVHGILEGTRSAVVPPEDENLSGEETMLRCYQNLWGRGKALEGLAAKLKGRRETLPTIRDGWGNTYDVTLAFGANGSVTATYRFNGGAAQSASGTLEYRGESTLGIFDEDGNVHYFPGSAIFLNLNLVKGGRAFLEVDRFIDEEGEVYQVDERVIGFREP